MTWDEAHDLSVEPEIVEADDVDPETVWTAEDLLDEIDRDELYRSQPVRPDEVSDFERYLDRLNEKTEEDHYS